MAEIAWLVDPQTLKTQSHLTVAQRVAVFNAKFQKEIKLHDVRSLFRGVGITKQRFRSQIGPPKPTASVLENQQACISEAQAQLEELKNYDIFQLDASLFNPKKFALQAWAPQGQPPAPPHRWTNRKYVAVFAAISEKSGCLLQMYKDGEAFRAEDIDDFLKRLRLRVGKHKKLAVFMDNASIHKRPGNETALKLGIKVIWNAPYRPDLNGIEFFWARLKVAYRKEVTRLRSLDLDWDQMELVQSIIHDIGFDVARDCAAKGWSNLRKAVVRPSAADYGVSQIPALRNSGFYPREEQPDEEEPVAEAEDENMYQEIEEEVSSPKPPTFVEASGDIDNAE